MCVLFALSKIIVYGVGLYYVVVAKPCVVVRYHQQRLSVSVSVLFSRVGQETYFIKHIDICCVIKSMIDFLYAYMPPSGLVINALPVCARPIWHNNRHNTKMLMCFITILCLFLKDICGGLVCFITIVNAVGFVFSSVVCEVFLYGKYLSLHK